ncbi:hypothetical protein [Paraburkholderia lacunae]|uniref:Uncharacterized protein n=1 Tax=Paraburkholderia lacunae TaxID=2211104 RepID=A0A370NCM6_9BURK|nr:hypothetical protein [Paraburkholderia lacunae]RDK03360.1 hypothetical protein DLM46_07455 [Paraburkholderia lacunae]
MQPVAESNAFISLIPLLLACVGIAFAGHYLAKDKGRPVIRWTILCIIPIVNFYCLAYLVGCTNLRLEAKLDAILKAQGQTLVNL